MNKNRAFYLVIALIMAISMTAAAPLTAVASEDMSFDEWIKYAIEAGMITPDQVHIINNTDISGAVCREYPQKEVYKLGEAFDPSGIEAVLVYKDGREVDISSKVKYYDHKDAEIKKGTPLKEAGELQIKVKHEGNTAGVFVVNVVDPNAPTAKNNSGWPFVPSDKHMDDGPIKSGWAEILTHDMGRYKVNKDKTVSPSRNLTHAFYFEHLGNRRYYIRSANGGYLSYKGNVTDLNAQIIISNTPCKWYIEGTNEGGYMTYAFMVDSNPKYIIRTWGYCYENKDSQITLHNSVNYSTFMRDCRYSIYSTTDSNIIPKWWADYTAGKEAPKVIKEETELEGYDYYGKLAFSNETKLPAVTGRVDYNVEVPEFKDVFPNWATTPGTTILSKNERGNYLEAYADGDYVIIRKYSADNRYLGEKPLQYELPIFGGIYSGKNYNYIAFGQNNTEEKDSKESIRIVKYDKEFNRISSVSLTGGQTKAIKPLDHTGRFAENGNQLILHTARTRYKSSDGLNHQSNLDVIVNTDTMKVTYVSPLFPDNHVSHSFDTYVLFDGNVPVYLDHGDASPRSVLLQKGSGSSLKKATMFEISGPSGANYTGVTVGGLAVSDNNYLTAIATIDQSSAKWAKGSSNGASNSALVPSNHSSLNQRDIVVSVVPRSFSNGAAAKKITVAKYIGTSKIASAPQILKVSGNKLAVIWGEYSLNSRNNRSIDDDWDMSIPDCYQVQYIDENGNKLGNAVQYLDVREFYSVYLKEIDSVKQ